MMNKTNKIVFSKANYENKQEFYETLFSQLKILLEDGHAVSIHESPKQKGVYAIQFANALVDDVCPVWLDSAEIMYVSSFAAKNEYENAKELIETYEQLQDDDDFWEDDPKEKKSDA